MKLKQVVIAIVCVSSLLVLTGGCATDQSVSRESLRTCPIHKQELRSEERWRLTDIICSLYEPDYWVASHARFRYANSEGILRDDNKPNPMYSELTQVHYCPGCRVAKAEYRRDQKPVTEQELASWQNYKAGSLLRAIKQIAASPLPDEEAKLYVFREMLTDKDSRVRRVCAAEISHRGHREDIEALQERVEKDTDPDVRAAAAAILQIEQRQPEPHEQ